MRFKMLRNKVDDSPGGGGQPPPGDGQANGGGTPPPGGNGQNPPRAKFSPEQQQEVDRIVEERLARDRATRSSNGQQPQQPSHKKDESKPDAPVTRQEFEQWQRKSEFDKLTARAGVDPAQETLLWTLFDAAKPPDAATWLKSTMETFGLKGTQVQNPNNGNGEGGQPPASAPNPGGKVDPLTTGGLVDIFNLSLDQVVQLGPQGLRKHHEENLAAARQRDGAPPIPRMPKR